MGIDELRQASDEMSVFAKYRFLIFIFLVVVVAGVLVVVGMSLYYSSGAAQVDLSRPGYQSIRSEAAALTSHEDAFPSSGPLDEDAFTKFDGIYSKHAERVTNVDNFSEGVLSDESLLLDFNSSNQDASFEEFSY